MHCEQAQSVPQQMIDHESSKLIQMPDDRLSPNLFLNLNFDNTSTLDSNVNSLKFEWSSFNPTVAATAPSNMSPIPGCNKQTSYMSSSPTYEFLNVDHFNIDNFKNECILNLDQNLMSSVGDSSGLINGPECRNMDLQSFSMSETKELLDLEKPININVTNLDSQSDKYQWKYSMGCWKLWEQLRMAWSLVNWRVTEVENIEKNCLLHSQNKYSINI